MMAAAKTSKGESTRAAILDRAVEVSARVGLEGLSIGSLADDLGLSKSGLYAHFDSKESLQVETLDLAAERFRDEVVSEARRRPRGLPRFRALLEGWLEWETRLPAGCPFIAASTELDDRPGRVRDRLVRYQRAWLKAMRRGARIAVREGHLPDGTDPEQIAWEAYGVILSYHHHHRLFQASDALERARRALDRLLDGG